MTFSNPITGGQGALVRPAIKSPNFVTGVSGWIVRQDGTAEFADLLIRSSDGSGRYIEFTDGSLIFTDGSTVYAEAGLWLGATNDPGFIVYNPSGRRYYAMLSRGFIEFGEDGSTYDAPPVIEHYTTAGADPSTLSLGSGYVGSIAYQSAVMNLVGAADASTNPKAEFKTSAGLACDVSVSGSFTADNIRFGTTSVPAPGGSPAQTSVTVNFANAMPGTARVVATPDTTSGNLDTTNIRWATTGESAAGFTLNCWRDTNFPTNFNWIAFSD